MGFGAFAALAGTAGSSILGAFSQIQQGKADYALSKYNAQIDEQTALQTLEGGFRDEARLRRDYEAFRGQQEVAVGKSGVAFEGSILDVLADGAAQAELDAMNIRYGAAQQARSLRINAATTKARGKMAKRQSRISAASSLLGGAASIYGQGHALGVFS